MNIGPLEDCPPALGLDQPLGLGEILRRRRIVGNPGNGCGDVDADDVSSLAGQQHRLGAPLSPCDSSDLRDLAV